MSIAQAPKLYIGKWRSLLEQAGVRDTTTIVLVIQIEQYHADIRVPAHRLNLNDANCLEDYSFSHLGWLTTQQGFTSITQINGNLSKWLRDHDFQPFNHQRDIEQIKFESDDELIETGVDVTYREVWERISDSHLNLSVMHTTGENSHSMSVPAKFCDWLDFEISFGDVQYAHYGVITLSTLPFRQGNAIALC